MNKAKIIGIPLAVLLVVAAVGTVFSGKVDAFRGWGRINKPAAISQERIDALQKTYEQNDYDAWKKIMDEEGENYLTAKIDKDNFGRFAEAQRLMGQARDLMFQSADIMDELDINPMRMHMGKMMGNGIGMMGGAGIVNR